MERTPKEVRGFAQELERALGGVCERVQFLFAMLVFSLLLWAGAAWTRQGEAGFLAVWPLIVAFFAMAKLYEVTKCVGKMGRRLALEEKIAYTVARGETREALEEVQLELSKINEKADMNDGQKERYSDLLFIRQELGEVLNAPHRSA